jgi:hypothetical protein
MVAKKKPRKSRASGVTVAARRVKRSAAKHGVKLSAAQIAEARRERVFSYMADPLEVRASQLAHQRSYSPEMRAMLASRPNYEGTNFDPRRFDASRTHDRFMSQAKLPLRNPAKCRNPSPKTSAVSAPKVWRAGIHVYDDRLRQWSMVPADRERLIRDNVGIRAKVRAAESDGRQRDFTWKGKKYIIMPVQDVSGWRVANPAPRRRADGTFAPKSRR